MERLTKRIDGHAFYAQGRYETTIPAEMETEDMRQCLKRLAAYEDTGLEPEEIDRLQSMDNRARMAEQLRKEDLQDEVKYLKKRLEIEKAHSAQMERERDAAVKDLKKDEACFACAHNIRYTGVSCAARPGNPVDGSCDFKWRGIMGEEKER